MDISASNLPKRDQMIFDKLAALLDEGSFAEFDAYRVKDGKLSAVVTGCGSVSESPVFVWAQDADLDKGALDTVGADKIAKLYDKAIRAGAPVVALLSGAGARIEEGVAAASAYGKILKKISEASGVIPQLTVVDGSCSGLFAAAAAMTDVVIATEKSSFSVSPASVLKAKGLKDAGSVSAAAKNGTVDIVAPDFDSACEKVKKLVSMLPQNNCVGAGFVFGEVDDVRLLDESDADLSVKELIAKVADEDSIVEFKKDCGENSFTGILSVGTAVCAAVGTNGGKLTAFDARKIAEFVSFADAFGIPVVTFVDSTGVSADPDGEKAPLASDLAKLALAYSDAKCAKITVLCGNAYGAAYTLLGSASLGADLVLALDNAKVGAMAPDTAVQFLFGKEIAESRDAAATRKALTEKWIAENADAKVAAEIGDVSLVIPVTELYVRIGAALRTFWRPADGEVLKKHAKLPF